MTPGRRSAPRRVGPALIGIAITIAFSVVMINVVLPWAAQTMADGFVRSIEQQR